MGNKPPTTSCKPSIPAVPKIGAILRADSNAEDNVWYWPTYYAHCTGWILHDQNGKYIITAAHCFEGYDLKSASSTNAPKKYKAEKLIFCEGWDVTAAHHIKREQVKDVCIPIKKYWIPSAWGQIQPFHVENDMISNVKMNMMKQKIKKSEEAKLKKPSSLKRNFPGIEKIKESEPHQYLIWSEYYKIVGAFDVAIAQVDSGKSGFVISPVTDTTFGDTTNHDYAYYGYPAENHKLSEYDITTELKKADEHSGVFTFNSKCMGGVSGGVVLEQDRTHKIQGEGAAVGVVIRGNDDKNEVITSVKM